MDEKAVRLICGNVERGRAATTEVTVMNDQTSHCGLRLDPDVREDARRRLLSLRGHVDGIARMLERDEIYCVDVLKQIKAVEGALGKVGDLVLRSHLHNHVTTAHERGDTDRVVEELMDVLKYR